MQAHILFGIRIVPWFCSVLDMNEHVMTCCNVENSSKSTSFEKPELFRFEEKDSWPCQCTEGTEPRWFSMACLWCQKISFDPDPQNSNGNGSLGRSWQLVIWVG